MDDITISCVKLAVGVIAFLLIGWLGARDKRIGGVLLTFPLLNGIAMLTGLDPAGIAATVYLIIIWNSVLFLLAIRHYQVMPPILASLDIEAKIIIRVGAWVSLWAAGACGLISVRDVLPSGRWLFALQLVAVACYVMYAWSAPAAQSAQTFSGLWLNWRGLTRTLCFIGAFGLLLLVARISQDSRWVGWASALPIAGLFALATLSATQDREDLLSLGDTVLIGPLMVIPFNWLLSSAIIRLRMGNAGIFAEIATVVAFWLLAAALVFAFIPKLVRWRDELGNTRLGSAQKACGGQQRGRLK